MGAPGCDDAPVVEVPIGAEPRHVTLVYPYYENPRFLHEQLSRWAMVAPELRFFLSAIVVDDGSPNSPASEVLRSVVRPFPIRLFRIEVDVRWNWLAARNIGAHHAPDGWLLLTDMDHVAPAATLETCIYGKQEPGKIYRFSRVEHTGAPIHPHPNSWFMTRAMFWRVGGYDEALSGFYGTDGDYRRRCVKAAKIRIMSVPLERHEYQGDSSTTAYKRKQPEDAGKKAALARRGKGWRPRVLSFPYHEVGL